MVKTTRPYLWHDAELAFAMLNAGSLLNKTEELAGLARQKNLDIIGVTETWLHGGIRDGEVCLPGYALFRQDHPSHKKGGGLSSTLNSISYLSACCSHSPPPSPLYVNLIVCERLFNTEPPIIALVYRSPNTPPPDNTRTHHLLSL